jgi:hypothetical protein
MQNRPLTDAASTRKNNERRIRKAIESLITVSFYPDFSPELATDCLRFWRARSARNVSG